QPATVGLKPDGFDTSSFAVNRLAVRRRPSPDPLAAQHGQATVANHADRLQLDTWTSREDGSIRASNVVSASRERARVDQYRRGLVERDNGLDVLAVECRLKQGVQMFGRVELFGHPNSCISSCRSLPRRTTKFYQRDVRARLGALQHDLARVRRQIEIV